MIDFVGKSIHFWNYKTENKIYDEKNGLWYEKQGDYDFPCLELPEEEIWSIGIWRQRHARYLKQHRKIRYYNLLASRKRNPILANIDKQAQEYFETLIDRMKQAQGMQSS